MTYYKAVRPNGTSFHDSTFRWLPEYGPVEGHTVTHPTARAIGEYASSYLSVSVTPTDCTGMEWPCRLFEVEPAGEVTTPDPTLFPSKRASVAWRIVRELTATDALGPQGVQVAALIERASSLTGDEVRKLASYQDAAWDASWYASRDAARYASRDAARYASWYTARNDTCDAAWDAAAALVVRDLISVEHYNTLTLPWRQAIGPIHPDDPYNK